MRVNNSLHQSLSRPIIPTRRQKSPEPFAGSATREIPAAEVDFNELEAPIQSQWQKPAGEENAAEEVLTNGEKQIIDLMFNFPDGADQRSYGPRKPRPVPIGNFVDLRG